MSWNSWAKVMLCVALAAVPAGASGCGGDDDEPKDTGGACDPADNSGCESGQVCQAVAGGDPACFCNAGMNTGCADGQACELVAGGNTACFAPVSVKGKVFDTTTQGPIEGAHVVARDVNEVAVSGIAVTDKDGLYSLRVPAQRDADGKVLKADVTLRADAAGYLTFPKAPRVALPFDLATAAGDPLVVQSTLTDIGLIPLPDATGLGSVSGKVLADDPGGTLVVAGSSTGTAGTDGSYTVFNVAAGTVDVRGYLSGVNLETKNVAVKAGEETTGVDLAELGTATARVSGKVNIVNPGDGKATSVILAVEETFVENAARGEAPPGLRAGNVLGDWSISDVPDGRYVVLGAFENDFLVRDPDTSIGGTAIQHITVAGADVTVTSFKITGALAVIAPDGAQQVSGTPTFQWEDDSSEDTYTVKVFDALGTEVWKAEGVVGPKGSAPAELAYGGSPLKAGMYYQFRATSIKDAVPISQTEDLKGVFIYK